MESANRTVNPAHVRTVTLICASCDGEWEPYEYGKLAARELGDGSVCVTCPTCDRDLAVLHA